MKILKCLPSFNRGNLLLMAALAAGFASPLDAVAATFVVVNNSDGGPGSLRQAIADSNQLGGSNYIRIQVDGSTAVYAGELLITNDVTISAIGSPWFWLQGNYSNRIFHIVNASVTISGMTIINGSNSIGGGIWLQSGNLMLNDCRVTKNKAINGGGIAQTNGTLIVTDSIISSNNAPGTGSGLYLQGTSTTTLRRCSLIGNAGTGFTSSGGGFSHNGLSLSVEGCTFCYNGGTGGNGGGGINNSGNANITNCTFFGNLSWQGGGIAAMGGAVTIRNSILASNSSSVPSISAAPDCFGTILSGGYNLVGNRTNSSGWGAAGDQWGTTQTPLNPKLGPLQYNGGLMQTLEPLPGSTALDRGHSSGIAIDQRGGPRTIDVSLLPNVYGSDGTDIGAVERAIRHVMVQSVNNSGPGTLREAILNAGAEDVTEIGFSWELESDTITLSSELLLNKDLIIRGPGAPYLAMVGTGGQRAIHVTEGKSSISGLTIRGFNGTGNNGWAEQDGEDAIGGAILNEGTLHLSDCTISNNWVKGGDGADTSDGTAGDGGGGLGGAVANLAFGILSMTRCLLADNSATGGPGGQATDGGTPGMEGNAFGGSFYNAGSAYLTNCCIHSSRAFASNTPDRGTAAGGGIYNLAHDLNLITCTVASNTAFEGIGGGIYDGGYTGFYRSTTIAFNQADYGGGIHAGGSDFGNTLIAGNTAGFGVDAEGQIFSSDYNFLQRGVNDVTVIWATTYCIFGVDPLLGPLKYNGGPMPTIALLPGSPAIDQGTNFGINSDLRGCPRSFDLGHVPNVINGNGTDIGAYELNAALLHLARSATNAVLWWSTNDPFFELESTTNLASPSWVPVPHTPTISSNHFIVVDPLQARKFYRLRSP